MNDVNQTPESPQVPAGQSPALGAAPEAIEVNSALAAPTPPTPATPELGGVFKAGKSKKPSKLLLWLLIVLGIIIVAGGGYFAWAKYGDQILIKLGIKEATPAATITDTTTTDETADWSTLTDAKLSITLKYPASWQKPVVGLVSKTGERYPKMQYESVAFSVAGSDPLIPGPSVQVTNLSDYSTSVSDQIKSIFTNQTAVIDDTVLAPINDSGTVYAYSTPTYLSNKTNTLRGFYLYSAIDKAPSTYVNATALLTDGANKVIRIEWNDISKQSVKYRSDPTGFNNYVKALTDKSDENAVSLLNTYILNIGKSVELTATADWKTYTNSTYRFSVKYPTNWNAQQDTNNSIGNIFSYGFNNGEATGVSLNVWNEDIAPVKTSKGSSEESSVILNDITWTILDLAQDDVAHSPASRFYLTEKNGKTFELNSNDSITILNQAVTTFEFTE